MHAIPRLLENDAAFAVEDLVGHFLAAMCWEAVHDAGVGGSECQELGIDLVGREAGEAFLTLGLLAHAGPNVSVDDVSLRDGVLRLTVLQEFALRREFAIGLEEGFV